MLETIGLGSIAFGLLYFLLRLTLKEYITARIQLIANRHMKASHSRVTGSAKIKNRARPKSASRGASRLFLAALMAMVFI